MTKKKTKEQNATEQKHIPTRSCFCLVGHLVVQKRRRLLPGQSQRSSWHKAASFHRCHGQGKERIRVRPPFDFFSLFFFRFKLWFTPISSTIIGVDPVGSGRFHHITFIVERGERESMKLVGQTLVELIAYWRLIGERSHHVCPIRKGH